MKDVTCAIKSCGKVIKDSKVTYYNQNNELLVFCSINCKEAMQKADSFK